MVVQQQKVNRFYFNMGLLLLVLVFAGFGSVLLTKENSISSFPPLFHFHALSYIIWFGLFIFQAHLIGSNNRQLHKKLGYSSVVIVILMLVTGFLMASHSYQRGISPIPDITIQHFLAFPLIDLFGLLFFFSLAILNRHNAVFHKHAMLMTSIAVMDPAIARLALSFGFPPAALIMHIALVLIVLFHDRRLHNKVHFVTWLGFGWVILRIAFIFGVGATNGWANMMNSIFA